MVLTRRYGYGYMEMAMLRVWSWLLHRFLYELFEGCEHAVVPDAERTFRTYMVVFGVDGRVCRFHSFITQTF